MATQLAAPTDDLIQDLTDDLIEKFFLHLPPEDPASLVHAALVCRRWCRILADRGFRRRFCEHHHRRPPLLGYFRLGQDRRPNSSKTMQLLFTPTSPFRPRNAAGLKFRLRRALHSRHGRVLISEIGMVQDPSVCRLYICDPVTGDLLSLPSLPPRKPRSNFTWNAVVLCPKSGGHMGSTAADSGAGCDCDSHGGPFLVVFIGAWDWPKEVCAYVYSSQTGAWSHTASASRDTLGLLGSTTLDLPDIRATAVTGDAVYFKLYPGTVRILKYDLGAQEISLVDLPTDICRGSRIMLLTDSEYGGLLGVAILGDSKIEIWWSSSGEAAAGPDGCFRWEPSRVIDLLQLHQLELEPLTYVNLSPSAYVVDIVYSLGAVIIRARDGLFSVNIESKRVTKLCEYNSASGFRPYTSFCTPALGAAFTGEGPSAVVSKCKKDRTHQS